MPDIYSTDYLLGVVSSLKTPATFFTRRYFGRVTQDESEEIHFDVLNKRRRLAPYVSPQSPGRVVSSNGFTTDTFKPAYTKDKRALDPSKALKRMAGERIGGGQMSPAEREQARLIIELNDQLEMIYRTKEAQAVEAMRTGGITVSGVDYPTANIAFGRNQANDMTLTGTSQWSDTANAKPVSDLRQLHSIILKSGGGSARDVIMDVDAWEAFMETDQGKRYLDQKNRTDTSIAEEVADAEGVAYQGTMTGFNFFTYEEWNEDASGTEQPALQSGEVVLASSAVEGVQAHGAIRDKRAGLRALEYFPKSWEEEDPSVTYLLMQSSFLMVPTRVNGSGRIATL